MKRPFLAGLFFCLVSVFVLACGGGGGGDGSTTGTAPRIENVVYYRLVDGNPQETSEAWVGDKGTFILSAWDPDKDITHLVVDEYHPVDATTPYRSRTEQVPSQSSEYIDLTPLTYFDIDGPAGTWRTEFYLIDSKGNESNVWIKNHYIHPLISDVKIKWATPK